VADYMTRLERLEQQYAVADGDYCLSVLYDYDDRIEYAARSDAECQVLIRVEGESEQALMQRAINTWGLDGERTLCVRFVASNNTADSGP
jgi:hypothetical protein